MSHAQAQDLLTTLLDMMPQSDYTHYLHDTIATLTSRDLAFTLIAFMIVIACLLQGLVVTLSLIYYCIVDLVRITRDLIQLLVSNFRIMIEITVLVGVPVLAAQMMKKIEEESVSFGSGGKGKVVVQ